LFVSLLSSHQTSVCTNIEYREGDGFGNAISLRAATGAERPREDSNWLGKPLISHEVIVNLIAATTTGTGLKVRSEIDTRSYPPGIKVSDREVAAIDLRRDKFHGDWNYTFHPRTKPQSAWLILLRALSPFRISGILRKQGSLYIFCTRR
jgi:hypothetical protein